MIIHGELTTVEYLEKVHKAFKRRPRPTMIRQIYYRCFVCKFRPAVREIYEEILGIFINWEENENEEVVILLWF